MPARSCLAAILASAVLAAPAAAQHGEHDYGPPPAEAPAVAPAEGAAPVALPRLRGPVVLDGRPDEAAWAAVPPLPLTLYQPTFGGAPTERTEIRVAYDDRYLYAAARCYDATPDGIRANALRRDGTNGSDALTLLIDPLDDNANALAFWTNPAGVRGDQAISADGAASNPSWNTYWDVATAQDATGWFAEMRIPFSSLGLRSAGGGATMGLIATRTTARKNEVVVFPAIPPSWSTSTPSQAASVRLERIRSQRPLYVTPYALGGLGQRAALDDAGAAYVRDDETAWDVGLDLKYALTTTLTLDATVNTDFAQAEADDQQVNLTRFSLFFPEKRAFFQERSGLFDFTTQNERLFHSRQIGLVRGRPVPILAGARVSGRAGGWDVGALSMQTARDAALGSPSENFGVLRLQRRVLNAHSTAGGIVTSRVGGDGAYNVAYGLDADLRLFGHEYLTAHWAQTVDEAVGRLRLAEASLVELQWQRRRREGWSYYGVLTRMGADYRPDLGFVTRRDYTEWAWLLHYNAFPGAASRFRRTMPLHFQGAVDWRNADGSVESATALLFPAVWTKGGAYVGFIGQVFYEDLRAALRLPEDSAVPAGSYAFWSGELSVSTSAARRVQASVTASAGSFYDGRRADLALAPVWNVSRHLRLTPTYAFTAVRFPARAAGFDAHIGRLRVEAALDTRLSAAAFVQYASAFDAATVNARFRYNLREGNDLWLVYNEGLNTDRRREVPALPRTSERTLLLKYTHTFRL